MPLSSGTKLGPYEILAIIGAGGMGEVYKARDTRLDRIVAVKVSREKFSARFEREARAVASLNHSHICTLHDVGPNYLVMEYIDGTPLKGPLPLGDALRLASQIAGALDAAHRKGITHRDLKPGNILVTKSGVKLLDFGLAKTSPTLMAEDATQTMALTEAGMILGTLQYMSPEQLEGREVDPRSDLFSFGLVLYELLAGTRAFPASTQAGLIVAILKEEPRALTSLQPLTPPALDRTISRCLAKDPDDRWQSARDLKAELEWIAIGNSAPDLSAHPPAVSRHSRFNWMLGSAVAALVLLSIVLGASLWRSTRSVEQPLVKLDIDLGAPVSPSNAGSDAILSPDGTRLIFVSQGSDGKSHLSTRRLDQAKVTELANTQGAYGPFFSPDGQWVGFFSPGKLNKIPAEGGDSVTLCDAPAGRGASWGSDDNIIAALETHVGLSRVPASGGGAVTQFTNLDSGSASHRWPQILPGGKAVMFTTSRLSGNFSEASVAVASLVDGRTKIVLDRVGPFPHYLPSGHLMYISKGTLFAVQFDLERLEVHGSPAPILEGISYSFAYGFAQLDVSPSGKALYRSGKPLGLYTLKWLDSTGKTEPLRTMPASYQSPRLSPKGNLLAFTLTEGSTADVWVYDLDRDIPLRLTNGQALASFPVWSPDSQYVVFQSTGGLFWARADGGGTPQPLMEGNNQRAGSFAPDGRRLVFSESRSDGRSEIKTVPIDSGPNGLRAGKPELFLSTPSASPYPVFAPDGKWIAYGSTEAGAYEVYVRAFPDNGSRQQISSAGGMMPVWSRNHELFYRTQDERIMVANYSVKGDVFGAEKPRAWSNTQLANTGQTINLDISPDGKRFAVVMPAENLEPNESRNHVTLLLNFSNEVRRRLASR